MFSKTGAKDERFLDSFLKKIFPYFLFRKTSIVWRFAVEMLSIVRLRDQYKSNEWSSTLPISHDVGAVAYLGGYS